MVASRRNGLTPEQIAAGVLEGNRLALARLLTQVEDNAPEGRAALDELFPHTGHAHLIGVTGAPGTGKSSLVNQLARYYRQPAGQGALPRRVAVVAVDPSSPFTGGAILGDRVRMRDLSGDEGVFIRSMASRGSLGGLAAATAGFVQALDAAGYEIVLIETVGAGQAEVDIARLAHTTLVVEAPGLGDDIQAIKAGILEIADILVINKADRPGVETTERALRSMLQLAHPAARPDLQSLHHHGQIEQNLSEQLVSPTPPFWQPPILRTVATEAAGTTDLIEAIQQHRQHLEQTGGWQRQERRRLQAELDALVQEALVSRWRAELPESTYQEIVDSLLGRRLSPYQAVERLVDSERRRLA
jgi:LAO/AO transport system kinase